MTETDTRTREGEMSAHEELLEELEEGETVEAVVFGAWGWGHEPEGGRDFEPGYGEPEPSPVPLDKRGVPMSLEDAAPLMQSWAFSGGYGAPDCYATYIWTNRRVLWVTQYDGSTRLSSAPRHPVAVWPDMPGG